MPRPPELSRRDWFRLSAFGAVGAGASGWLPALAADAARSPQRKRACILLWMAGGPSTIDLFDLKPGHENGGPFKEIQTATPGLRVGEHLPKVARHTDRMAVIRSMSTREGDHGRATYALRTGYTPTGTIQYPPLGALVAKELGRADADLPPYVSIAPYRANSPGGFDAGFLPPRFNPLIVADDPGVTNPDAALTVPDLTGPAAGRLSDRLTLLGELEAKFGTRQAGPLGSAGDPTAPRRAAYDQAVRLMRSAGEAFDLGREPAALRDAYGRNLFGQGCLLARRLVERGVPFVEVALHRTPGAAGGWDTHQSNFDQVKSLCGVLDPAWATLMSDLKDRGMLDSTTVVWMGEFGRTPKINATAGRDHWPASWATVLAGGGVNGGQVVGRTSKDGTAVEDRPVSVPDFLATTCLALGIDPMGQNDSNVGRPIRIADPAAKPVREVIA